ncbi:lipopolysaccharide biosynthesis protein [Variovorax sp. 38R]|uniref:lipopolysaccharide biosynthesis protein n=1 Tax=Variovorax sp. 38R TaxID=2774875 RepID=UPI0017820259|nr:oligosaccharide flippase family protein [Variovorax sp. 38R]QOF79648.1 oligosaccharide flippase family protein [Variovorax sp. 38R]
MPVRRIGAALRAKFQSLKRTDAIRSVGVLVGGTAFAQALAFLALPVITRLYTPSDFNVLAIFSSILSIISVIACMRLEISIPMPEGDEDAVNLLALALCACSAISALTGITVWLFPDSIVKLVDLPALKDYLWLLPFGVWLASAYAAMQFWTTRKKRFGIIAGTRMTQAVSGVGVQLGFGINGVAPLGLLLGQIANNGAGLYGLVRAMLKKDRGVFESISWRNMRRMLRKYDRFLKYSTFEALANTAAIQMPIIIIGALAIGPEAGYLMLAMRAMTVPLGLIGSAVSQVYLSRASEESRIGRLVPFTLENLKGLVRSGVGPLIFAGLVAPILFPLMFGTKWQRAGELVAWMTPWFVMQFLTSPISMALHITNNQRVALAIQLFGLILRVGAVCVAGWAMPMYVAEVYAISGFVFYLLYLLVIFVVLEIKAKEVLKLAHNSRVALVLWVVAGVAIVSIFRAQGF